MSSDLFPKTDSVIGIIGGVGPYAGVELMRRILDKTRVSKDQDHLPVALLSYPNIIEDRTDFILKKTRINPAYTLAKMIVQLERLGSKIAGIACNTSYAPPIYNVIISELNRLDCKIKLLNIVTETIEYLENTYSNINRIGLLTTHGVFKTKVYSEPLLNMGYEVVVPDEDFQFDVIHNMIYHSEYGIKASSNPINDNVTALLSQAMNFFVDREVEAIILGCTEFALIKTLLYKYNMIWIDTIDIFADSLIREYKSVVIPELYTIR